MNSTPAHFCRLPLHPKQVSKAFCAVSPPAAAPTHAGCTETPSVCPGSAVSPVLHRQAWPRRSPSPACSEQGLEPSGCGGAVRAVRCWCCATACCRRRWARAQGSGRGCPVGTAGSAPRRQCCHPAASCQDPHRPRAQHHSALNQLTDIFGNLFPL